MKIKEDATLQSNDNTKNIATCKFKEKLWCDKELLYTRKLKYYKKVINPNLEDQKFLCVLTSIKKKITIVKIRTKFHKILSETMH